MASCDLIAVPGRSLDHGMPGALLCECDSLIAISWGENSTGIAICECGNRYAYKIPFEKFVRA